MEPIRININKQLKQEGIIPVISYPADAAYDFNVRNRLSDIDNLATDMAYNVRVYSDGTNMQTSLIKRISKGLIEYSILIDTNHKTVDGKLITSALQQLAKAYETLKDKEKPSSNPQFTAAVETIHKKLSGRAEQGISKSLPVAKNNGEEPLTYYMNYRTEGEISTLIRYPDQEFFNHTSNIYLVGEHVHPTNPQACKHIHELVLRTFKITSPDGYEYGQVKEGDVKRISLKGKEGMLPMTLDVKGDVNKPTPYGYFDTATNTIRIDERGIKFFYELRFIVNFNERRLLSGIVRYNGEQVMPDNNGYYLIKVYEEDVQNAGEITFKGEGMKDAVIKVTPGIVKQKEYVFNPEPQHDVTRVTLDFGDGRPINAHFDIGTSDRLFNQLKAGKVKGYKVKKDGQGYKMYIPRKLSKSSKNILRLIKFIGMILFTLALYSFIALIGSGKLPWPLDKLGEKETTVQPKQKTAEDDEPVITTEEDDAGLILDRTDQITLENKDYVYLQNNDIWRKDSIQSDKYLDVINTIFNGSLPELKLKNYNSKVINNQWWALMWKDIIVPNNVHRDVAREVFNEVITPDHNSLDIKRLYEELTRRVMPTGDKLQKNVGGQVVPSTLPPSTAP
jgi:hypothetical protein